MADQHTHSGLRQDGITDYTETNGINVGWVAVFYELANWILVVTNQIGNRTSEQTPVLDSCLKHQMQVVPGRKFPHLSAYGSTNILLCHW